MLDPKKWGFTGHALERALDMRLTPEDIEGVLEFPDEAYPSQKYRGRYNHRRGDLAAGIEYSDCKNRHAVVTFLWANQSAWADDFSTAGYTDRTLRANFRAVE